MVDGDGPTLVEPGGPDKERDTLPNVLRANERELPPGSAVGRYIVLDKLGEGAMGVVYRAYDHELDRKVAIKLLRAQRPGRLGRMRDRLLREAQAMARLSHPNIVAVHDVGTRDDAVFVAMDIVEGQTLREWIGHRRRPWAEVLSVFVAAGRGLAAAHEAGLVHRDFKPDNVLIDSAGVPYVTDFGLARVAEGAESSASFSEEPQPEASGGSRLGVRLTRTGTIVGTPAYMAPEQRFRTAPDSRSDQFSFCIAFYEALFGGRPFAGKSPDELTSAAMRQVFETRDRSGVPRWLRRVVLRGLRAKPEERFSTMQALVSELESWPARMQALRLGLLGIAGVLAFFVGSSVYSANRERERCGSFAEGPERVAALSGGARVWETTVDELDAFVDAWKTERFERCAAARIRGEQSEQLFDRQLACLHRLRWRLESTIELLGEGEENAEEHAVDAAFGLPAPASCREPPQAQLDEPAARAIARTDALADVGRAGESRAELEALLVDAEALLRAEILVRLGGEEKLYEAIALADRLRRDRLGARAWVALTAAAQTGGEPSEALELSMTADAAIERAGGDDRLAAKRLIVSAELASAVGSDSDAVMRLEQALGQLEASVGSRHPEVAEVLDRLASAELKTGELERAVAHGVRALSIYEDLYGPQHEQTANATHRLAEAFAKRGDKALADVHFQRAATILGSGE